MYVHTGLWWEDAGMDLGLQESGSISIYTLVRNQTAGPDLFLSVAYADPIFEKTERGPVQRRHMPSPEPEWWRVNKGGAGVCQKHR